MHVARAESLGFGLGLIAVAAFAGTLPATRIAVRSMDPVFVGLGRAVCAAAVAGIFLLVTRARLPTRTQARELAVTAVGVVIGFPLFTAWAMRAVDASHGGLVLGILPLATALAGTWLARERPSRGFWLWAGAGSTLVVGYSLARSSGTWQWADLALFAAVISAAIGYAQGARVARTLRGMATIAWALVLAAPALAVPVALHAPVTHALPASAWFAFAYVALVSQFLAFAPWYHGLALGGIARVSQAQLVQPFLTILISAALIGEGGDTLTWTVAVLVVVVVAAGRRAAVARPIGH